MFLNLILFIFILFIIAINKIFTIFLASLQKANEKAKQALYTSDMDTEKETKNNRKIRAKRFLSSSESEEESSTNAILPSPPRPPAKCNYKKILY